MSEPQHGDVITCPLCKRSTTLEVYGGSVAVIARHWLDVEGISSHVASCPLSLLVLHRRSTP